MVKSWEKANILPLQPAARTYLCLNSILHHLVSNHLKRIFLWFKHGEFDILEFLFVTDAFDATPMYFWHSPSYTKGCYHKNLWLPSEKLFFSFDNFGINVFLSLFFPSESFWWPQERAQLACVQRKPKGWRVNVPKASPKVLTEKKVSSKTEEPGFEI